MILTIDASPTPARNRPSPPPPPPHRLPRSYHRYYSVDFLNVHTNEEK